MPSQIEIKSFCAGAFIGLSLLCWPLNAQDVLFVDPVAVAPQKEEKPKQDDKQADEAAGKQKPAGQAGENAKGDAAKNKPAARRRVAAPRVPAADVAKNAIEQQMRRQLEPALKVELSFAVRAAELNADERGALIEASKKWFDMFIADFIKNQDPNQRQMFLQGGQMVWFGGQARRPENPRDLLRAGLAKVVANTVPKEKAKAYEEECSKRDDFLRKVSIANQVAQIDERVILSPDQRQKVTKLLTDHWDKNVKPQVETFALNGSMWYGITDQSILPALSAAQQAVLTRQNSISRQVFFGNGMFGGDGAVIDDIDLGDLVPKDGAVDGGAVPVEVFR